MGLPFGIWLIFIGLNWVAEAFLLGGRGDSLQLGNLQTHAVVAGNLPGGGGDDDDILRINQELIPPEAPESSFLLEGDIVKASPFRVFSSASPKWSKRRGIVRIPYVLSYKYDKQSVKIIKEAFADFAEFTCIKFVPYSYQRDFISVTPMSGCFSSVGRTGGMQVVSLAPACLRRGKGVALHELMHVVGFWHEHSRADRDKYISISWNEILTGFEINFMKSWTSNMLVNYDYSSVLHYGRYAFSMTGLPTITPLSNPYAALGQRWNLSSSDIARVNKLYKCSQTGAEAGSPSTIKEDIISNELEPCPTEGETKISTTSPTSRASSPGTNPPETAQSARGSSKQMSALTAGTEKLMGRTAMNDEELRVSLTTIWGLQSVKFAPTGLSTQGMTYLEATGKTPPTRIEMGTAEAEGKFLVPMEETSLLGTVSVQEPDFTTVMLSPESQPSPREVTSHHGKVAEGLGTTKIPTETLAGLEFPELVSSGVAPVETGGTRPSEAGIAETTSIQGMELAYHSTYLTQKGPSPATEVRVVALTSNQTWSLETQTELATAEITSFLAGSSGTYTPVMHTAATRTLGQTPPMQVSATETSHSISTEKWTTSLPRLTSAKSVTIMAPTKARSAPTGQTPSVEMETTTVAYATEQTSLLPTTQNWTSSPAKQRNQSVTHQAYTPGSQEQSTIAIPASGLTKTEPPEAMQPTLTTSFEMAENHTTFPELQFPLGAITRHKKSTSLSSSGIETSSIELPTKAIPFMETQTELGFVEATRIKASGQYGFPSLTEGTYFPVTKVKDTEYATETDTLPVTWVSQASEPAEMSTQATTANYRNKERIHTTTIGPTYTLSLGEFENPVSHPQKAGPAEATRREDRSQATLSTRSSTEMGVQEARNTSPNQRRGHTYTPASVLTSSTATELKFMERPTKEASGLETTMAQTSSPSEMGIAGVSSAWTEAKDQFSSSPREATLSPTSSATEKGNSTKVIQSLESASLSDMGTKEHRVHYRVRAGLVTLNPPESRPMTASVQSMEMPEWTGPRKLIPVHTEPTTNQVQRGVRNTTLSLVDKMLSLQTESIKATYPAEGPLLLQVSPQTFSPIELRLKMSRKQQMHADISSRDNLTPPEGTPTASLSSGKLQHSAKATSTQASETHTMKAEETEGRGNAFLFPMGTLPAEKTYMKPAMGISESQTTNTTELQIPEASLAHTEGASFPMTTPSETVNTQLLGTSETHTTHAILTWEPRSQVKPRKQMMAWFTKASPLNAEHVSKGTSLEAPAEFRPVENTGNGMETKEHGSLIERISPPLGQAPEVTFPPETLTTNSAEMGVQEAINLPRKRSRWVSHAARSIKQMSLAATEPTHATVSAEPGHSTIHSSYRETAEVLGTGAGNQLSLSVSSSRMELGAQEFKGELRMKGRQSPTLPSVGRREFLEMEPSLKSQVTLLQASQLRKGLFPFRQTQPFWGMKSAKPVIATEESPHATENWQLYREQTSTNVLTLPSLRTPRPPPLWTPASPESNKLGSYRETQATSLHGEQAAPSILTTESAPSARTAISTPPPDAGKTRTNSPVEMVQATGSYKKKGRTYIHTHAPVREMSPVITEQSSKMVLATKAIEDQTKMRMETHVQATEGRGAVPATKGMLPVASESTKAGYLFPEAFGTETTNVAEVGGGKEAPNLPREGGREVASTLWSLETQTVSTPESATTGILVSLRKASARTEQTEAVNLPVTEVVHGQFLEAQTKTTPQAVVGLQGAKSHGTQGRVFTPIEGTKAMHVMSSFETAEAPVTNPHTRTANTTGIGPSLQDTTYVPNRSMEMKVQEAASNHGKEGGHTYTTTPAGRWPVMSESEHLGHPTERTLVQETQSLHPEIASIQTKAQNLSNTKEGTSIAKIVTEAVHSTRVALLLETPENQTLGLREVAMKEETNGYGEKGGLTTTHLLPSFTLSAETAEQVQSTHVHELILPENWPTGHPELGTGKHTTNQTQTGEQTSLISMGELPSLESEPTKPAYPTEGTSLLQTSPHHTFSLIEQQITTTNSQETPAVILPWEEHGQSPMSPRGVQPAETEASELLGLFTQTTSTWPPETPAQKLEEVSVFHRKRGRGKPSPLPTDTAWPAENETYMLSSTKIALGRETLVDQTTSQTVLGITEVSLALLLGGSTRAERASFPGAEVTEAMNQVPSNGIETQTTLPNETRELIPTARTQSVGTEATGQSYSTTMKAVGTPSNPSERMLATATSGHRKKNGDQAYTHPPTGSTSSAGSNTTSTSSSLGLPYYQVALASTEPVRTQLESGVQSAAGEMVPTSIDFSLKTQTASPPAEGNGRESNLSTYGGITPVGHWGLRHETYAPEWHSSQSEKWDLHTTTLANSKQSTPQAQSQGARTATNSAVGGMPTSGTEKAHGIKVIPLKRAFRKHPTALFAVDPEILHLVGKRSLPDVVASPAPPQDSNPVIILTHGQTGPDPHSLLLSNALEKQRAKALEAFPKQHFLLPGFQVSPVTALSPTAKAFKNVPWWLRADTSDCALNRKCGLFRPKEHLFLGRKKVTNLAPFLMSAKAVQPTAPPGMVKPIVAPLPRQQSGPGKHGHSIQTTPKVMESGLLEWQVCDFEEDLCSWRQSNTDDFDWILAGERPARSLPGGNVSDPHDSPSGGNYISLRSPSARQTPGQKTALISPVLHGIGCIRFWYNPLGSAMGTINLYIKLAGAPEWHRIWTAKGKQGTEWHQVGVVASESQKLQVMVEGVIGPEAGSDAGIDDLSVCAAECQGGCEALFALYKK